jgi:putative glutamine amidotransferase
MRPVIGVTCDYDWETGNSQLRPGYFEGVYRSGGLPFLIPVLESSGAADVIVRLDGLLLTGGQDIDPRFFHEEPHPAIGWVNPCRDELEIALCREAEERGIPVFGICRGVQLMNVAMGGDLYQDIRTGTETGGVLCHDQPAPKWYGFHEVRIQEGSKLREILGTGLIRANSFHHQAVRRPGRSLYATAHTSDGIIEAIESDAHPFFIGVQWHPERMLENRTMIKLFEALVRNAAVRAV